MSRDRQGVPLLKDAEPARPSSPLHVRLRHEEGGGAHLVAVTIAYRKAKIRVPLCARCKKVWRPALRARMVAVWSLTLGLVLVPSALIMGLLMAQQYHGGTNLLARRRHRGGHRWDRRRRVHPGLASPAPAP